MTADELRKLAAELDCDIYQTNCGLIVFVGREMNQRSTIND